MFIRLDVAQLSREEMLQLIRDYREFEQNGAIGQCFLREFSTGIRERSGIASIGIATLMRDVIFEVYRRLAMENVRNELTEGN